MIIKGNTVGTPMPRTDWNQDNPKKANYLRGREELNAFIEGKFNEAKTAASGAHTAADNAKTAADNAQTAADNAQNTADNAQNTADSAMTAAGNAHTAAGNALTDAKNYTDSKHMTATATLTASGWSSAAPFTQTVAVEGILETDQPHISPVYSTTLETAMSQKENWAMVCKAVTANGSITFTCFEDKPTVNIPVQMEVNR